LATDVGAVEKPLDSSDEYELPNEVPYGDPVPASETQDMEAFGWLLKLCDRVLPMDARLRLGEEPIRCSPLSRRCLPLSFGRSVGIVSTAGVPGVGVSVSSGCSRTTASMDVGSMALCISVVRSLGDSERMRAGKKGPTMS
jgi:hypothetical protein